MKVISLWEPWASLIKEEKKRIETRSWATKYRGELYIHASKKTLTRQGFLEHRDLLNLLSDTEFHYGCIIARCVLTDCIRMTEELIHDVARNREEYIAGDYRVSRYAWILDDVEALAEPIPAKGRLGIWECADVDICRHRVPCEK